MPFDPPLGRGHDRGALAPPELTEGPTSVPVGRPEAAKAPAGVTVTAATPDVGIQGTTLDVVVSGSGFDRGSRVDFARDGVVDPKLHINSTTYHTTGELVANVTIAADAVAARYDVAVTTATGKKGIGTERFAVAVPYEALAMSTALASGVTSVSATGWISGALDFDPDPCPPYMQPVVWTPAGVLMQLPLPAGRCAGKPRGVNRNGVVVGTAYATTSDGVSVRWTPEGSGYVALRASEPRQRARGRGALRRDRRRDQRRRNLRRSGLKPAAGRSRRYRRDTCPAVQPW